MIEILYGNYSSSKTEYIMDKIGRDVSQKQKCLWLVPEQKTVICEGRIARELSPCAQLYCEALNFTRLCNKVFRLYGGLKYNYISKSGKNLVMYRALCEVRELLCEYKIAKGRERGCVSLFLDAIGELKSYGVSPDALKEVLPRLENERLKHKIADLVCVFEAYERILHESYCDPYDDIIMLAKKLDEHSFFEGVNVYISSFYGFTGAQLAVLERIIAQAKNVTVGIEMDKDDVGKIQYAKLSSTNKAILKICSHLGKSVEDVSLNSDNYHTRADLKYLCDNIWRFDAAPMEKTDSITLMRPDDELAECEAIAAKIKELIMGGARYSDIAVIARSADTYRGIIDYVLEKYGIPFYMSSSTDVSSKPLIRMVYSAINASQSYSARDITAFIRSGYADISSEDADELECYMYRWGIYGSRFENDDFWSQNPDGYVTEPSEAQRERLAAINAARSKIIKALSILKHAFALDMSAKGICRAVYELLCYLNVKDKLKEEIKSLDKDEAMECAQLYSALIDALDTVAEIMPNEPLNQESFLCALSYALDGVRVGSIPTGEDKVTVGEAGALRTESIKYAFVIGVTEGAFPQSTSQESFFSDADKSELETVQITLSAGSDVRADDELLNFKSSISTPSHALTVSSPRADIKGAKKEPSIAYLRILALFPSLAGTDFVALHESDKIYTERTAREHAAGNGALARAIRELFGIGECAQGLDNTAQKIEKQSIRALLGDNIYLSQSKIEKFVSCPFQYYCSYLLGLKSSEKISFGSREIGVLAHSVLESFLKRVSEGSIDLENLSDAEIARSINDVTEDYIRALYPEGEPSMKLRYLFERVRTNIAVYVKDLAAEFAQSEFRPTQFELPFSKDKDGVAPLCFDIGDGAKITLSGVVDRVDVFRQGDTAYVRIADYKTGQKKFSYADFDKGLELQLLIYLFTLCRLKDGAFKDKLLSGASKIEPAGFLYYSMQLGKGKSELEEELGSPEADAAEEKAVARLIRRSGVFLKDEAVLKAQDKEGKGAFVPKITKYTEGYFLDKEGFDGLYSRLCQTLNKIGNALLSGDARAESRAVAGHESACTYCEHRAVCRRRSL